jgi:hypothetical protein
LGLQQISMTQMDILKSVSGNSNPSGHSSLIEILIVVTWWCWKKYLIFFWKFRFVLRKINILKFNFIFWNSKSLFFLVFVEGDLSHLRQLHHLKPSLLT